MYKLETEIRCSRCGSSDIYLERGINKIKTKKNFTGEEIIYIKNIIYCMECDYEEIFLEDPKIDKITVE